MNGEFKCPSWLPHIHGQTARAAYFLVSPFQGVGNEPCSHLAPEQETAKLSNTGPKGVLQKEDCVQMKDRLLLRLFRKHTSDTRNQTNPSTKGVWPTLRQPASSKCPASWTPSQRSSARLLGLGLQKGCRDCCWGSPGLMCCTLAEGRKIEMGKTHLIKKVTIYPPHLVTIEVVHVLSSTPPNNPAETAVNNFPMTNVSLQS